MAALSAPSHAATPERAVLHIPSLDGLRAASFFMVFAAHAGLDRIVPGGFGVTVFFFLSGYLITTLMRVEESKTGRVNLRNFYLRRALRILPPFYIVLLTATALAALGLLHGAGPLEAGPVASQILHVSNFWFATHGWNGVAPGTGVYWSLAVEEHFYLLFPTVYLALGRGRLSGRGKALVFWASCAAVLAWRCFLVLVLHAPADRTYLCSDTRVDSIAFGCALACWNNPVLDRVSRRPSESAYRGGLLFAAGVALLLVTFLVRDPVFRETLRYTLQGIALTPIFVAAIRWPEWLIFRPFNCRTMRFIGTLSYTLYLVHQVTLAAMAENSRLTGLLWAVAALAVSLTIAWTMYRLVEKPCANLRRRLSAS